VQVIAASPVPMVLVTGESGTGKQAIARMLHDGSPRAGGSFVELNCSAIPETLVESELFGHERGAFSDARERKLGLVEVADGGTLFLDEIGDLGTAAQAKLLTFLEQRTFRRVGATAVRRVDTRVVAATNRDLRAMVAAHALREDLYYRLNAITVHLPPLRARPEDIPALTAHFLDASAREFGRRFTAVAPEAAGLLAAYRWPGNVRELRAVISRAALLHDDELLRTAHLPPELVAAALSAPPPSPKQPGEREGDAAIPTLEEIELAHIRRVLEICQGNRTAAAQRLGITRQTLAKKIGPSDEA
jgi:transcriptional regulator with PAS, ATPase and Fis domain